MYAIADLETFTHVARYGGITAAARHQGIAPATVSHRITKLEQALGLTLFHRNSRSFALTDEGAVFLERVTGILADLAEAEAEAGGGTPVLRGHLRVTLSPWILSRFILPVLGPFRDAHPELTVEFLAVDRFVSLVEEGQDCAVRVGPLADSALKARKVAENARILCAAPIYLERAGIPRTLADLVDRAWVCLPWQTRIAVQGPDGRAEIQARRSVHVSNADMLTEAACQGLGLVVKSRLAVQDELDQGALVEVMPGALAEARAPIWFVTAPEARTNRKARAFGDLVVEAFRRPTTPSQKREP